MRNAVRWGLVAAGCAALLAGCGGDALKQMMSQPDTQMRVMEMITGDEAMTGQMVDRLLGSDSTRAIVLDRLLTSGAGAQELMSRIARDRSMVDGVLGLAVQDSAMRQHVMTLFRGMQMGTRAGR